MKKFLVHCSLFFLLILGCLWLINFRIDWLELKGPHADYMSGIALKHKRVDSIHTTKIIMGGGSNLAFGIDSKSIQDSLGVPVVNMGLHAALGLDFMLNELKSSINENDVVLLSIEYFLRETGDYGILKQAKRNYPPSAEYFTVTPLPVLKYYIEHDKRGLKTLLNGPTEGTKEVRSYDSVYSSESFNPFGDIVGHLNMPAHDSAILQGRVNLTYSRWGGIDKINDFNEYAKQKHVSVYYLFPCYANSEYKKNKKAIDGLVADLKSQLDIPILDQPEDFLYPDSLFFDTIYHLTGTGRRLRTDKLIRILRSNKLVQHSIQSGLAYQPPHSR